MFKTKTPCREKPGEVRARTCGTKLPSRSEALHMRFIYYRHTQIPIVKTIVTNTWALNWYMYLQVRIRYGEHRTTYATNVNWRRTWQATPDLPCKRKEIWTSRAKRLFILETDRSSQAPTTLQKSESMNGFTMGRRPCLPFAVAAMLLSVSDLLPMWRILDSLKNCFSQGNWIGKERGNIHGRERRELRAGGNQVRVPSPQFSAFQRWMM